MYQLISGPKSEFSANSRIHGKRRPPPAYLGSGFSPHGRGKMARVPRFWMASGKCRIKQAKIHFGTDVAVYDNINKYSLLKRIIIGILKSVNYIIMINYNCQHIYLYTPDRKINGSGKGRARHRVLGRPIFIEEMAEGIVARRSARDLEARTPLCLT